MPQAKRTRKAKASPRRGNSKSGRSAANTFKQGFGFFITGLMTGVIALIIWQGYHSLEDGDMGSGLKAMMDQSRQRAEQSAEQVVLPEPVLVDNAPRIKPQYDFYTVLPEIEEVLPKDTPPEASPPVTTVRTKTAIKPKPTLGDPRSRDRDLKKLPAGSSYMLQVASYGQEADAERLKAKLAMSGMRANIQKVTIESRNYYRVRIGPYTDYGTMTSDDYKLSKLGFKAMRLRLSKAG